MAFNLHFFNCFTAKHKSGFVCSTLCLLFLGLASVSWANIFYVKATAPSGGDGLSWNSAFSSIQDGVDAAFDDGGGEVWVAKGEYSKPSSSWNNYVIEMKEGVHLYGGFTSNETNRDQRDWTTHHVTIKGSGNTRCIIGANNATLNGFIITSGGITTDPYQPYYKLTEGGGMLNESASPIVSNCTFINNRAYQGGAIYNTGLSSPEITNCRFENNDGFQGGGIYNASASSITTNCIFKCNRAYDNDGQRGSEGGAIYNSDSNSKYINCLFEENEAHLGGAAFNNNSPASLINCLFTENTAHENAGGLYIDSSSEAFEVYNCIFWNNKNGQITSNASNETVRHCCIQGGYIGTGNLDENPHLVPENNYRVLPDSPCIDAGTSSSVSLPEFDFAGNLRVQNSQVDMGLYEHTPGEESTQVTIALEPEGIPDGHPSWRLNHGPWIQSGHSTEVYPGEYVIEFFPVANWLEPEPVLVSVSSSGYVETFNYAVSPGNHVFFVNANATGDSTGLSWEDACTDIQTAIDMTPDGEFTEIWVAAGTYIKANTDDSYIRDDYVVEMKDNIHLYGGFDGDESVRNQRNLEINKTYIDGQGERRCVLGANNATLDGFTIQNAYVIRHNSYSGSGGGMVNKHTSPIVRNCYFRDNMSTFNGGAIWNYCSSPQVINCCFTQNTGNNGGAIRNDFASPYIVNCLFMENRALILSDGIDNYYSSISVSNSILWDDTTIGNVQSTAKIIYSCIKGGYEGEGNIDDDPLLSLIRHRPFPDSPCIDAGYNSLSSLSQSDLLGQPRIQNGQVDIGPYEYSPGTETIDYTVILKPSEITPAQPMWSLENGTWYRSNDSVRLYPGRYKICFTPIGNWKEPDAELITVSESTISQTFHYTHIPGNYIIYVNNNASGDENGTSWEEAFTSIQSAVNSVNDFEYHEVWVVAGSYGGTEDNVVEMKNNINFYGGFSGTETSRDQRDWENNETIITGEESRRCVLCKSNGILDGFTIYKGQNGNGSGLLIYNLLSPTIINCTFKDNSADQRGGGIYINSFSTLNVTNCILTGNSASWSGGCIYINQSSILNVSNCTFTKNKANYNGGAISTNRYTEAKISNCYFSENYSSSTGGAIGQVYGESVVSNSVFRGNTADSDGSAIFNYNSEAEVINCLFNNNTSYSSNGVISNTDSTVEVSNCIIWNNADSFFNENSTMSVSYSCIMGGYEGENNFSMDPRLDPVSLRPLPGSPCINKGTPSVTLLSETDLLGNKRIQGQQIDIGPFEYIPDTISANLTVTLDPSEYLNYTPMWRLEGSNWYTSGTTIEAYVGLYRIEFSEVPNWIKPDTTAVSIYTSGHSAEFHYTPSPNKHVWYVNYNASGLNDGNSWENAYTEIMPAIIAASDNGVGEVWVAEGVYENEEQTPLTPRENVHLYGGFKGNETSREQRCRESNKTIILGNGEYTKCVDIRSNTTLDGFIIKQPHYNSISTALTIIRSSPAIRNCIFKGAYTALDCDIISSPVIDNCIFENNKRGIDSGRNSSPLIMNCLFKNNETGCSSYNATPVISNCLFIENDGTGIWNNTSNSTITNCLFFKNNESGISIKNASPVIKNCILLENGNDISQLETCNPIIEYNCLQNQVASGNNIYTDPKLDPVTHQPLPSSPCIDAGDPDLLDHPKTDFLGNTRINNNRIDMGPYEYIPGTSSTVLTVNLGPEEILSKDPRFRISSGPWINIGTTFEIYPGSHPIEFSPILHWKEPDTDTITITSTDQYKDFFYTPLLNYNIQFVDSNATGANNGSSWEDAFTSIQPAVDTVISNGLGEVWVASGRYTNPVDQVVNIEGKVPLYGGFSGNEVYREQRNWSMNKSIIDGEALHPCVFIDSSAEVILDGFTVTKAYGSAVYNYSQFNTIINNCHFTENTADRRSGTIYNNSVNTTISNCLFTENSGETLTYEITNLNETAFITNCLFRNNTHGSSGAVIHNNGNTSTTILNCTISDNDCLAIFNWFGPSTVINCITWDNKEEVDYNNEHKPVITYSCIEGGFEGKGNIDQNPKLHLKSLELLPASPCINAGSPDTSILPQTDRFGNARVQDNRVDMGASEYIPGTESIHLGITTGPSELPNPDRKWKIDYGSWLENGESIEVYPGTYPITFTPIAGWKEPDVHQVSVSETTDSNFFFDYTFCPDNYITFVDVNATGENNGESWENAFTSIQDAINLTNSIGFGQVWVASGIYTDTGDYVIELKRDVALYGGFAGNETFLSDRSLSSNPPSIIDCQSQIGIYSDFGYQSILDGFTIRNGYKGLYRNFGLSIISNCIFINNGTNSGKGGAIYNSRGAPLITNCLFIGNHAEYGGAIMNDNSDARIINCTFVNNTATKFIGGIDNYYSSPTVMNCVFQGNNSDIGNYGGTSHVSYSCLQQEFEGVGNIFSDPLFVDADQRDFRLSSNSPCIDAGTYDQAPLVDIRGLSRTSDYGCDMGPFEFHRSVDQESTSSLQVVDLSETGDDAGWVFHRPDIYRDIEGEFHEVTSTWDVTLTNNEMSFGYVESPFITVVENDTELTMNNSIVGSVGDNALYRATFQVFTNFDDPSVAPTIRLRTSSESLQRSDLLIVSSEHTGDFSPTSSGRFYSSYFVIPENESRFRLNFDVLSFEPRDSKQITFSLGYVDVEYVGTTDSLGNETSVMSTDFVAGGQSGWQPLPVGPMPIPAPSIYTANVGEGLLIRGLDPDTANTEELPTALFGFWGGDISELPLEQGLYRVRWTVGSDIQTGHEESLPAFRLRFNDETLKFASMVNIESMTTNMSLPSAGNPVTYDSWFQVPSQIAGNDWNLSFDYLYINKPEADDPTAALILEEVEVTRFLIP